MKELKEYFLNELGIVLQIDEPAKLDQNSQPLYIKGNYYLWSAKLFQHKILFADIKNTSLEISQVIKQKSYLQSEYKSLVVFVFKELLSWQRKKLIDSKTSFIQPWKQIYLPDLLLVINDMRKKDNVIFDQKQKLSFLSQYVLLYHLQIEQLEGRTGTEIADKLNLTKMSVSRVTKELNSNQIIETKDSGREKIYQFTMSPKILWVNFHSVLSNPVREKWFVNKKDILDFGLKSGEEALSEYSSLSSGNQHVVAMGKMKFREWKNKHVFQNVRKEYDDWTLEVWHYDPVVPKESKTVDKLSLFLSLNEYPDERTQIALGEMINTIAWSKDWTDSGNTSMGIKINS
jgi:DNA-binding MarR family transcriptional regulator